MIALGADQYDDMDEDEARQKKSFFAYYYMVVQVGGLLVAVPPELLNASVMWGAAIIVILFILGQAAAMAFYTKDYGKVGTVVLFLLWGAAAREKRGWLMWRAGFEQNRAKSCDAMLIERTNFTDSTQPTPLLLRDPIVTFCPPLPIYRWSTAPPL